MPKKNCGSAPAIYYIWRQQRKSANPASDLMNHFPNFDAMIKFGTKVVCINDSFTDEQKSMIPSRPVRDHHYTIDEVIITRRGRAVTLVELDNPPLLHPSGGGTFIPSFDINRFRELEDVPQTVVKEELQATV
ncbi:MAG TPA: hypothetical protein VM884_11205 [Flavisolibacter sp.]|nr:hypothetical protein [Flavisolibacter sp.]